MDIKSQAIATLSSSSITEIASGHKSITRSQSSLRRLTMSTSVGRLPNLVRIEVCEGSSTPRSALSRSEEHTSELQSLMRISYAVFCLKKKKIATHRSTATHEQTTHTNT